MEKLKMLELLNRIKICIERGSLDIAKDLIELEIENLKGITEQRCKNTKYYYYDWYCQYCSNFNCNNKKNEDLIYILGF